MGRLVLHWVCVCALVVPLVGCSDDPTATGGTGGSGGIGGDGGTGGVGGDGGTGGVGGDGGTGGVGGVGGSGGTVELTVTATDGAVGLEGVKLCEFDTGTDTDTDNCDTTDGNGNASIRLAANQEISYTLSKDPFVPYLVGDVTDETFRDSGPWPMGDEETAASWADAVMLPDLWADGFLMVRAFPRRDGVTFDLVDETATVYYFDATGTPTVGLSATTTDGSGGFVELSTGEYQAEFGGNATNCIPDLGWPGDTPNRIRAPVKLGHLTFASMTNCDEP